MPTMLHGESEAGPTVLRGLALAVELSVVILLVEVVGAVASRSLSLTVDAIHNIPDLFAFMVSWAAVRSAGEGASETFTFGTHRGEVFAGLLNATIVLLTGGFFGYLSITVVLRGATFAGPVGATWLLATAIPVLVLRSVNLLALRRVPGRVLDLNFRSVVIHLASDIVITLALLAAGTLLLLRPAATWVDPIAALAIAATLIYEAIPLFRGVGDVLSERTPRHLSVEEIARRARSVPGVSELHDVHVWAVCPTLVCMTAHVTIDDMTVRESMDLVSALKTLVEREFGILHAVFEVESVGGRFRTSTPA